MIPLYVTITHQNSEDFSTLHWDDVPSLTQDPPEFITPYLELWHQALQYFHRKQYLSVLLIAQKLLTIFPSLLSARQLARTAALKKNSTALITPLATQSTFKSTLQNAKVALKKTYTRLRQGFTMAYSMPRHPMLTLVALEKELADQPTHFQTNWDLYRVAIQAHLPHTATFALETLVPHFPQHLHLLHTLAQHYLTHDHIPQAAALYHYLISLTPADLKVRQGHKEAVAQMLLQGKNF